jgi:hypothetical protein
MYLIARLELSYAGVMEFMAIAPKVRDKMEALGCKLLHAMLMDIDRLNTVLHIWDIPDANTYFAAVNALKADPDFPEIVGALANAVVNETLSFASDTPYAPVRA